MPSDDFVLTSYEWVEFTEDTEAFNIKVSGYRGKEMTIILLEDGLVHMLAADYDEVLATWKVLEPHP